MLIILDNFEQIIEGAEIVARILAACPRIRFLATSREALRLQDEFVYRVPTLSVPELEFSSEKSLAALCQYDAVALFIDRAQLIKPDFNITNKNAPSVAEICVRLEGIPLAIELATARLGLLSPQGILSHLDKRLKFLTKGARDLPGRQSTLRATIE